MADGKSFTYNKVGFLRADMFAVGRDRADRREAKHQHKDW